MCAKTSKPEDEQLCITVHTVNNNICDLSRLAQTSQVVKLR